MEATHHGFSQLSLTTSRWLMSMAAERGELGKVSWRVLIWNLEIQERGNLRESCPVKITAGDTTSESSNISAYQGPQPQG